MSVHYKFKSAVEYDTLPVDGLNISLGDLKEAIIQQKRLGKGQPYDLQITNAETKEVYTDEKTLIPKNSSLIVARVPIDPSQMKKPWDNKDATALILSNPANIMNTEDAAEAAEIDRKIKEVTDLTRMEGSEQDKINAMVAQSTMEYHPSKYVKLRASKMTGSVPIGYRCYKCNQTGHWVTMCPLNNQDLRKSTGIPSMFLEEVKDPNTPGVMISATGKLVRLRDTVTTEQAGKVCPPSERPAPPEELQCRLCNDVLRDAVLIPCCTAAFCDDCIRNHLLDSEEHVCPACREEGIGPDTLIPNRYLRIKVQQFECGCFYGEKKTDGVNDGGEPISSVPSHVLQSRNTPTPPQSPASSRSPAHSTSPSKIRLSDKLMASPVSLTSLSPLHGSSPSRPAVAEPLGNGDIGSDKENVIAQDEFEAKDAVNEEEHDPPSMPPENETPCATEEKENIEMNEGDSDIDGKPKKIKKKKAKRKNSRHEEEESDERERKKRERKSSHKSQEKKAKRRDMELLKDVDDLPEDKAELWDDDRGVDTMSQKLDDLTPPKKKKKHRNKDMVQDALDTDEEQEKVWKNDRPPLEGVETSNRSRSNSGDKVQETPAVYVPFNPLVPPPNFVKSPPQDFHYPVTSTYVPSVVPPIPVTSVTTYPHYQPGLIADPLTEFEKHLREKDERAARRHRYSRSRSPSRSPRCRRGISRSRQRTWSRSRSRSRSRSISRPRGVVSTHSPRSPSRRRWSRSPPPRGHAYRSRSPSFSRDRSVSNRSLSLSRTPSPNRRIMSPSVPLHPVHQPVHPEPLLARPPPPVDYGVPRDYNRYPMGSLPQDQYPPQSGYPPPNPHWDTRFNQVLPDTFKPSFPDQRGRGGRGRRGRGAGFRPGTNYGYDQRGQEYRQYDRSQHMLGDRHGMPGAAPVWDRDGRQSYTVELPRSDRGNRHPDSERRRYPDEYEDMRSRRGHDEGHAHVYSSDDEWRRYSDDGKKRDEDSDRRKYEGRRGLDDRKEDSDSRRVSDGDDYEDFKRSRKENDGRRSSYDRSYKDVDDGRSNRHEREGKHRGGTHRDSPRDEELHFRSKPYDSPGKSHKKSSPKDRRDRDSDRKEREVEKRSKESDRRDKEADRKERDSDRRERENDKRERHSDKKEREGDRRAKDNERRDRDEDRREREDRRDRDYDKQERDTDRRDRDYDRKDSYRRDREQDRKGRDGDRRDKDADRRDRDSTKREKEPANKDKTERNDDDHRRDRDGERSYSSRWDHGDMRVRSEKEADSKSKSQERESSLAAEERDHKRKNKRKEDKDKEEGHHKEKGDDPDSEKVEKKKHEKKKKKKEKRRASQASTEVSQGEVSGDEGEDKKKKKKREKKKKAKGATGEGSGEVAENSKLSANDDPSVGNGVSTEPAREIVPKADDENNSATTPREQTPNIESKEASPSSLLPLPPLSKWERDEDLTLTPKGLVENKAPEEEKKVTDDILKRAENTLFSGRGLAPRKVFLDPQKQRDSDEKEKSPTPEWERLDTREAKRRGTSIQITISSKTESQIGRPRAGRHQQASPERVDDKKYPVRTRRSTDTDSKTEKNSRLQKRSQSPSESRNVIKTRRKSEKEEYVKEEKESANDAVNDSTYFKKGKSLDGDQHQKPLKGEFDTDDGIPAISSVKEDIGQINMLDTKLKSESESAPESSTSTYAAVQEESKPPEFSDKLMEETINVLKGVKRSSPSTDELQVKKLKLHDEHPESEVNETVLREETTLKFQEGKHFDSETEAEFAVPALEGNISEVKNLEPITHANSNLVQVPISAAKGEELEEGEITTDSSGDDDAACQPAVETPLELNFVVQSDVVEEPSKTSPKIRHSPIRVPSPVQPSKPKEILKVKEKTKKRKKRKRSSSSSSSNSSSSSSSSSSSEDEEIVKKKKKKKKKKKAVDSDSSDGESQKKHKKKKKEKKKKKKKEKKKKSDK